MYEGTERAIDTAEQTLPDGLESENPMTRLKAAAYFLRLSEAGRCRGWDRRGTFQTLRSSRNHRSQVAPLGCKDARSEALCTPR